MKLRSEQIDAKDLLPYWQPGGFFFEREGEGVVAFGAAATISVAPSASQIADAARLVADSFEGFAGDVAPIVVGSLPFDGNRPATLIVPRVAIVRRDGRTTALLAGNATVPLPDETFVAPPPVVSDVAEPPRREYVDAVRRAREAIRGGTLDKVVLARSLMLCFDGAPDVRSLLASLRDADPHAYTFAFGEMIGATPEQLVERRGEVVRCGPLAGTAPRGTTQDDDRAAAAALRASAKDQAEHSFVVRAIREALAPRCETLTVEHPPSLMQTSRVWHLRTRIEGRLRAPAPDALTLAAALHPTPAVGGTPAEAARAMIRELEPVDRGFYAGPIGWVDANGDGEWAIQLRCGHVRGATMRLFAGAGVVAGSDPEAELAETDAKFAVMRAALAR